MIRKVDSNSNSEMRLKDNNNENDKPLLCLLCCHYILQKANKNLDALDIAIKIAWSHTSHKVSIDYEPAS